MRWTVDQKYAKEMQETMQRHITRLKELKSRAIKLRKELMDLQKEYRELNGKKQVGDDLSDV